MASELVSARGYPFRQIPRPSPRDPDKANHKPDLYVREQSWLERGAHYQHVPS